MVTLLARKKIRNEYDSNSGVHQGNTDSVLTPLSLLTSTNTIRTTDHIEYPMKVLTPTEGNEEEDLEFHAKPDKMERIV
ncbi:hypothetical protein B0H10DRAFT_2222478 [Mycena sp. CBHHK59/15]|nr:hypothetical protein B0H10DRAFT_2222478 [Mycena sp. CBHHK59/15]